MQSDDLPIVLERGGPEPLAVQVADALRAAASSGALRVGDRLTSTRALASRLGVSRTVTAAAYDQLLAEGWLAGRRGSGTFVTAAPPAAEPQGPPVTGEPAGEPDSDADPADPADPAGAADAAGTDQIDLTAGRPCLWVLDRSAWRRAWRTASDRAPAGRPEHAGNAGFRRAVVEHLLRHRGLNARPDQVLATSGTTSALAELAGLLPRGAAVGLEEPGYQRAAEVMLAAGLRVVPVPVDEKGLRVDALPDGLAAVYCTPAHQFPLGSRLSAQRRVQLVELARARGMLIVEDDYDGELRYDVAPLPLLAALGPDVVVHLGTSSKLLTFTLGVGWLVAPPACQARLLAARRRGAIRPAPAGQLVFAALAEYGDLARHLRRLRRELSERRLLVVELLSRAGVPVLGDAAGAHLRVPLPDAEAERAVVGRARRAGVLAPALADYHLGTPATFGISVGYAGPSHGQLHRAVTVLASVAHSVGERAGQPATGDEVG